MSTLPGLSEPTGDAAPERARRLRGASGGPLAVTIAASLLIVALLWPMLFTDSIQAGDWMQNLWSVWSQSLSIHTNHAPSYFTSLPSGVLYPLYAFYAGPIYVFTATLALVPGFTPHTAYVLTFLIGFAAMLGGWYWLARMAGIARMPALIPGVVFVTSAYYMTAIYARGDWPEFLAVSSIPLMLASGYSVFHAERLAVAPALALAASSWLFTASHNLTLLWGSSVLAVFGLALILLIPEARRQLSARRVLRVASVVLPAVLLNTWFLLPDVVYQSHTNIAEHIAEWRRGLSVERPTLAAAKLFALTRLPAGGPAQAPAVYSLPVFTIAWVILGFPLLAWRRRGELWTRLLALISIATIGMGLLMTHPTLILSFPRPYVMLQFPHRLESYVIMGISASVLASLVLIKALTGKRRIWGFLLIPVLGYSLLGALQQVGAYGRGSTLAATKLESFTPQIGDYLNIHLRGFGEATGLSKVKFPSGTLRDNRASVTLHVPAGRIIDTNIYTYSNLVKFAGAEMLGIDDEGFAILKVGPGHMTRPAGVHRAAQSETITVSPADPWPVVLGRILTLCGALALLARLALPAGRARRAGPEPRDTAGVSTKP